MTNKNLNQNEIIKFYQEEFSKITQEFPIEEEQLYSHHKSIISIIKNKLKLSILPTNLQKNLDNEYIKVYNQNEQLYTTLLTTYLDDEFEVINSNIINNNYQNIEDYISDVKIFEEKIKGADSQCPLGPNMEEHINKYIYEQILNDYDIILNSHITEYDIKINDQKREINDIKNEIMTIQNNIQNTILNMREKENIIKQIESDKSYMIKQTTSNTDKIGKDLKLKNELINKLNKEIDNVENKNNQITEDYKKRIQNLEQNKIQKEKNDTNSKNVFDQKKIELQTKIDLLEKQIQSVNQARTKAIKSLTSDLLNSTKNSEIKKFEEQLQNLGKKIEKLTQKNNELSMELLEKDKILENEKNRSINIINEYEKKIKAVTDDHNYIEEKVNEVQIEENNNIEELKNNYETQIGEMKANFSKDELIIKSNIDKISSAIKKTNDEIKIVKNEYDKSLKKFEELKSKNNKDKVDYDKYIKILEDNNKRIMSQYDECVKENNNLKSQNKADIISINGETEKKIIALAKDSEKTSGEIKRKELEYNKQYNILVEKFNNLENEIPSLQLEEENLSKIITDMYQQKDTLNIQYTKDIEQIKIKHQKGLEELKKQCIEDLEKNKTNLKENLEYAEKECQQQKEELIQKMKENAELNAKNQEELIQMYGEKIKILNQVKEEKIEDLNNEINEINNIHQEYVEQSEEELQNINEQVNEHENEMLTVKKIISTIQSDYNALYKKNKEDFKIERNKLTQILEELLKKYNKMIINYSLEQKDNSILSTKIAEKNQKLEKNSDFYEKMKNNKNQIISNLNDKIKELNKKSLNDKNNFDQTLALKEQEIEYVNVQISEKEKDLDEFKKNYEEKINQCQNELNKEYGTILNEIKTEKDDLENNLINKKTEYKELEYTYDNQVKLLQREKDVLLEKLNNVTTQIEEVEKNIAEEKNNNYVTIENIKDENNTKNSQLLKENQALRTKLSEVQADFNEMTEVYEKDKTLWENKYKHLLDEKKNIENEFNKFKTKYNNNLNDLTLKLQNDRIDLQQIYNDAIVKRDEKFNGQINNANKYFASKFEYINNLNQSLTIKNNELLAKLNEYESQNNTKDKEAQLAVALQSITRYKKDINELINTKDKDIEELQSKLIEERKKFSTKMINIQTKLRNYEIKRTTFSTSALKQNVDSEKNVDDKDLAITRLKNHIAALEKSNFRLKIEKRDTVKDNKNLKRKAVSRENNNTSFIPKSRITTIGKENKKYINNYDFETTYKKNLLEKFNKQKLDNEEYTSIGMGSNSGSVILNASYI